MSGAAAVPVCARHAAGGHGEFLDQFGVVHVFAPKELIEGDLLHIIVRGVVLKGFNDGGLEPENGVQFAWTRSRSDKQCP